MYSIAHKMKLDNEEVDELVNEMWADDNVRTCENQYFQKACRWAVWNFRGKLPPFPAFDRISSRGSGSLLYKTRLGGQRETISSSAYMEAERNDFYEFALSVVSESNRDILVSRLNGYTYKEIEEQTGIKPAALSDRYNRCLKKIRTKYRA
jgi:hypothetical protein